LKFLKIIFSVLVVIVILVVGVTKTPQFGRAIENQMFSATGNQLICSSYGINFWGSPSVTCVNGSLITNQGTAISFSDASINSSWANLFDGSIENVTANNISVAGQNILIDAISVQGEISAHKAIVDIDAVVDGAFINCSVITDQTVLRVDDIVIKIDDGTIAGNLFCQDITVSEPMIRFNLVGEKLPVNNSVTTFASEYLDGTIDCSVEGDFSLQYGQLWPMSISADGDIKVCNGIVHATDLLSEVGQYLGNRTDLLEIKFNNFSHHMTINRGNYSVGELRLDGPDTDWTGSGTISLLGKINFILEAKLPAGYTPNLGGMEFMADILRDDDGRIAIPLKIQGQLPNPAVNIEMVQKQDLIQKNIESSIQRFLDKLK
jgi:hypothetical protein